MSTEARLLEAAKQITPQQTGAELIAAERERQINVEKWTEFHDSAHNRGELLDAATCYTEAVRYKRKTGRLMGQPNLWPWRGEETFWKPKEDDIRTLVKAGALIAAEIDRLINIRFPKNG